MIRGKHELRRLQQTPRMPPATERILDTGGGGGGDRYFWGIIQTCNYSAGTATVKRAKGSLGSLSEVEGVEAVTVYMRLGSWYIVGDEVVVKKSPGGVTPAYFVEQPPLFARHWTPPTGGELAAEQDNPSAVTSCS